MKFLNYIKKFLRDYLDILCFKKCYNDFSLWYALLLDLFISIPIFALFYFLIK